MEQEIIKMPWSMEQTAENLRTLKEHYQRMVLKANMDGKGEEDAKEVAFDFDRAIESVELRIQKPVVDDGAFGKCPHCGEVFNSELISEYEIEHCPRCGQAII